MTTLFWPSQDVFDVGVLSKTFDSLRLVHRKQDQSVFEVGVHSVVPGHDTEIEGFTVVFYDPLTGLTIIGLTLILDQSLPTAIDASAEGQDHESRKERSGGFSMPK